MMQTWIVVIISILFIMGTTIISSSLGYTILVLWIFKKSFSFHQFSNNQKFIREIRQTWMLIIISILFCYGHYNHVHLIGMHDIDTFIWQEKLSFLPFSLWSKFNHEIRQTWKCIIVSILFIVGTIIMLTSLGYTILMLWFGKKSFSFHYFPYNQSLSLKWDKLGYS